MIKLSSILLALLAAPLIANAASTKPAQKVDEATVAVAAPKENRIVKYTYSPDLIFRILTLPDQHTHIELGEDEGLKETPAAGDSIQWRISGGPRNIYVKPVREDIMTSLTLVTNKRTYQFQLIAGKKTSSSIYQKVSFDYPDREAEIKLRVESDVALVKAEQGRLQQQVIVPSLDPASLNFNFDIAGDAPFRPISVYHDGVFTYLRLPSVQDFPAIFLDSESGPPSLINYKVKDNMIIVERIAPRLLLKKGVLEVKITQRDLVPKKTFFWQ